MPKTNYNKYSDTDLYTAIYEQQMYTRVQKRPIKKKVYKRKRIPIIRTISYVGLLCILLFFVFPFSFKNFIADIFKDNSKIILNIDYWNFMYPTHNYLYKDLFLGKYIIKDTEYKKFLMQDIKETYERQGLKHNLLLLAQEYKNISPSVYVWEYQNNSYIDINADEPYPAASIIKLPVLIEMFREIEQGKFKLDDTMILEDFYRASGSGKLQYSQGGIPHTMDYLAKIMIENSDNSSTNMIISKIGGMPQLNRALKRWGMKTTHINNWLPDLEGTNITTARELGKMLYNINSTDILSQESKKTIANYLSHVKNNRLLQAGLPPEATLLHKTGDIGFMLGDAGIVKTANGKKYIVVILVKRPYNNFNGKEFIVKASNIIYNNILN